MEKEIVCKKPLSKKKTNKQTNKKHIYISIDIYINQSHIWENARKNLQLKLRYMIKLK